MKSPDVTLKRLDEQINWYDEKSQLNQKWFKSLKLIVMITGAAIPIVVIAGAPPIVNALLGIVVVVLEGVQQVNQYHHNWITYRSTCEALKHEKYLYLANAGPYTNANDPAVLLAERVESLVSQEHAKWISAQEAAAKARTRPGYPP